jgi:RNA-directed DNA polymerase
MNLKDAQEKTTVLQSKLYQAAKDNRPRRFYRLHDKLYREDVLLCACDRVRENGGAPGIDGVSTKTIASGNVAEYPAVLGEELRTQQYRPSAVRRMEIP